LEPAKQNFTADQRGFHEAQRIAVEETRAGINHAVLGTMLGAEQDDWAYFGRLRVERERAETE
jgi:hypothetical protein